jgi:hypothetical protein
MRPILTVGCATYKDFSGVYFTLLGLKLYHPQVDLIVVDNAPEPSRQIEGITLAVGGRYFYQPDLSGTSKSRAHVFEMAETEWVCCVDCHVLLVPGAIETLIAYARAFPESKDIISGPMIHDDGRGRSTHWQPDPTCGLWGVWGDDPRARDPKGPAFEIPMMGLGLFAMRRAAWPGFNQHFRGFGGEEGYIHEKVRQRGGRALCLPALGWYHRFRDVAGGFEGAPYPLRIEDHTWNLLVGHRELGIEAVDKIFNHFGKRMSRAQWAELVEKSRAVQPLGEWKQKDSPLERVYAERCARPTSINEHLPTLRKLASEADEVVEFGTEALDGPNSTIGLLAGRPKVMRSYDVGDFGKAREAYLLADGTQGSFSVVSDLAIPPQSCDLLFIDTHHTGAHLVKELNLHATACRRRIVLHDTETYGETGEDGTKGLQFGVRTFLSMASDWHCMAHYPNNNGLTVLSRDPTDPQAYPAWLGKLNPTLKVLGIWYTNNKAPLKVMQASLRSIERAQRLSRHEVKVETSSWSHVEGNPFPAHFPPEDTNGNHLTITRQMMECVAAAGVQVFQWEVICFLEHDTLYPEDYFDRVADAFLAHPEAPVVSNLDYEGLNATGFLDVKERHEPMHQLSLRRGFALDNLERCRYHFSKGTPDTLLEPDSGPRGDRSKWVRLPPEGRRPSLHVNFAGRFTSHGEVVYHQHSFGKREHLYWGKAEDIWDGPLDLSPSPAQVAKVPTLGQRGCPGCPKGKYHFQTVDMNELLGQRRRESENIAEHMESLQKMAFDCEHVTCLTAWHDAAFVALAAGLPNTLVCVCPGGHPDWPMFHELRVTPRSQNVTTDHCDFFAFPPPETDLLFISTRHHADAVKSLLAVYGPSVRKWIAFHNTVTYGENSAFGEDGRGLLVGIREWLRDNPQWTVKSHARNNNGLLVLTRLEEEKKKLPPLWKQAWNVLQASWQAGESVAGKYGPLTGSEAQERRLALCTLCPSLNDGNCAECGCPVAQKTSWPVEECPLGQWAASRNPLPVLEGSQCE